MTAFSPEVLELLGLLVDRLDAAEARGAARAQSVPLNEATWPALKAVAYESEKEILWAEVRQLHARGWIQIKPESAAKSTAGYSGGARVTVLALEAVRAAVGRPQRVKSAGERWREAVAEHLRASPEAKAAAMGYCIELPGRSMQEVVERLNGLAQLVESPLLLREVSAQLFWGMSKVLDARQGLVAAILGLSECPFPESPVQLLVQLPAEPVQGVLFIENQVSFERATRSKSPALVGLALVFAAGFKGSAARLRSAQGASVYYSARSAGADDSRALFERWLFGESVGLPAHFWGDLDWSGMGILKAMRNAFGDVQAWQPGYGPMLQSLVAGHGHTPEEADKQGQNPVLETGSPYADQHLLPALRQAGRFVDQELFTP